jgi:hypothetical protein
VPISPMDVVNQLGPYPILQMTAGAVVVVVSLFLMIRAKKDKEAVVPPPAPLEMETRIFMQGPLVSMMSCVRELVETQKRNEGLLSELVTEIKWMNRLLSMDMESRQRMTHRRGIEPS